MRTRLLFPLLTTAACLAAAVPASAATSEAVSENWAGYEVTTDSSTSGAGTTTSESSTTGRGSGFSAVSGSWTQPTVSCTAGTRTYSAYWVGLGGGSEASDALEQVGTQADCSSSGKASYYAWYELVPKAPVTLKMTIDPGDQISARTAVSGSTVTVTLTDGTTGQSVTKTLTMSAPDTTTAEWVAEAPSECQGDAASDCTPLALADFDKVTFTKALATADGHTGSVSDKHWTAQKIALEPESDGFTGPGYGGYGAGGYGGFGGGTTYGEAASVSSSEGAAPSKLSDKGASFTVSYGKSASGATSTATGTGSTYPSTSAGSSSGDGYGSGGSTGYGYGYGGYGYGSAGGYGYGYGDSYGYGGDGYADSYGYGYGDGDAYGYGDAYGDAYGYVYGVDGYGGAYSEGTYDGATGTVYGSGWVF